MPVRAQVSLNATQSTPRSYYCLVYHTVTGLVQEEIPIADQTIPPWLQQINNPGSYSVTTPIGGKGLSKETLRGFVSGGRFGLAICYGTRTVNDYIAQAGPIWKPKVVSESPPLLQITGEGLWSLLAARWQIPSTYNGTGLGDPSATVTYTSASLQSVAVALVTNQVARGTFPVDVPSVSGGTLTMSYYGYDFAPTGQRLQELTQLDLAPDIVFAPYFSDATHIRWKMLVGNPTLSQPGSPLVWDYGRNLQSVLPDIDSTQLATTDLVKGNGVEAAVLWASASDNTLTNAGWPLLEYIDTSHSNVIDATQLQGYANSNQKLHGRPVETWAPIVRADQPPLLGTYTPGVQATYNMIGHCWQPDGPYTQKIIGIQNGQNAGEVVHILHAIQGVL